MSIPRASFARVSGRFIRDLLGSVVISAVALLGCASDEGLDTREKSQDLTTAQSRVLGFEAPTQDWSSNNGTTIASSSSKTQGLAALAFKLTGSTQISSVSMVAPKLAANTARFDMKLPQTMSWGDVRLVLRAPSAGQSWLDLGGANLSGRPAGTFQTVSLTLSAQAKTVLNSNATDLNFVLVFNGPNTTGQIIVDNLVVSTDTSTNSGTVVQEQLTLLAPTGHLVDEVFLSGSDSVTVDDRSTLGASGKLAMVYTGGPTKTEFGGLAKGYVDVFSKSNIVHFRSQAHLYGGVVTSGQVTKQDSTVKIDGAVQQGASVSAALTKWSIDWPASGEGDINHPVDAPNRLLVPGRYAKVQVYSRATMTFKAGVYYLDSLIVEPQAHFKVDASQGSVQIYVKNTLRLNVGLEYVGGKRGNVLFGVLGTTAAYFEEAIVATVVAPNSVIELRRPASLKPHEGSFFGKSVHVFSDATILHIPFDWTFLCPSGDFDGDKVPDCSDECWRDPNKVTPGVCDCGYPDTDDDNDGIPNCEDGASDDPGSTFDGSCGLASDPARAAAGTPCNDGICPGAQTCDGVGHCGDEASCRPDPSCRGFYAKSTDKFYWVCDRNVSWEQAAAICDINAGTKLANVAGRAINALIDKKASSAVWIGANALSTAGEWRWRNYTGNDGTKFWTGGQTGKPVYSRYNAWGTSPNTANRCAYADNGGSWKAANCSEGHGFVCEVSNDRLDGDGSPPLKRPGGILGIPPYEPTSPECVDAEAAFGTYDTEAEVLGLFAECESCLVSQQADPSVDCSTVCVGPATPPAPNETCDMDLVPSQLSPVACGDEDLELALDGSGNTMDCTESADCAIETTTACSIPDVPCTGANEVCAGLFCSRLLMCDTQQNKCVIPNSVCDAPTELPENCSELEICEPQFTDDINTVEDGTADLGPVSTSPQDLFGAEPEAPATPPAFPDESCATCGSIDGDAHPWCKVSMDDNAPLPPKGVEDLGKSGQNNGDLIKFKFEPLFGFKQEAEIGPLGLPKLDVSAQGGVGSSVKLGFAGNPEFPILDALAELSATQCGVHGNVTLALFGKNLIADVQSEYGIPFDLPKAEACTTTPCPPTPTEQCLKVYDDFYEAVDRVKKAMRDAAEIMRQYKAIRTAGQKFPADLCRTLTPNGSLPRGFPVGNCPATGPTETPEQTIQRFIDYYKSMVTGFGDKKFTEGALSLRDYIDRLVSYVPNLAGEFTLYKYEPPPATTTIIYSQFFIGPIPAFIEVGSSLDYGVDIKARAGLKLGQLAEQILDFSSKGQKSTEVAYAGVNGEPHAGAGLYLFAGVGFGIPGFKVQLGIQGDIQLGSIYVPAYAGAGLWIGSELDGRGAPENLSDFSTGAYLIPPKTYSIQLGYTAGLEARVRELVSGSISAKLKLKVLFFSKTWKTTLFAFHGFCRISDQDPEDGSLPACDFPILKAEGDLVAADGQFGWGFITMPTTFPALDLNRVIDELPVGSPVPPASEVAFSPARVNELFYDAQCAECKGPGLPADPEDDCFSASECCGEDDICYPNWSGADAGRHDCRTCSPPVYGSTPIPDNEQCLTDSHCCDLPSGAHGICGPGGRCSSGSCNWLCDNNSDCSTGYGCALGYLATAKSCYPLSGGVPDTEFGCQEVPK